MVLIAFYLIIERLIYFYHKILDERTIDSQNNMLPNYYTSLKY